LAIVILTMWKTSSWIGLDGLLANYRQRHHGAHHHHVPWDRTSNGTVGHTPKAAEAPETRPQVVSVP
jgi:hypothetical protein